MAGAVDHYLTQLLEMHWLRPETALWRSFDCLLAERLAPVTGRAIDLGCGDGTLSYVMAGGQFENYDVFLDVGDLQNYNNGADIYNAAPVTQLAFNHTKLRHRYEYGVDHKDGLIVKAGRLSGFYSKTLVHDLDRELPFAGKSFDTAFSNILYWLEDLDVVLPEWHRILADKGKLILFVPNENFKSKSWLYYTAPHAGGRRYLNYFDRGYAQLIHHCYSSAKWSSLFNKHGFRVQHHQAYLTDPVMEIWNIGTRPIAPLLIDMANRLAPSEREHCKAVWVEYFRNFLAPIIEGELESGAKEENCSFHFFVLEKK
jgi:SAM-dependent methyltransferase